jgi:hypothetical protein
MDDVDETTGGRVPTDNPLPSASISSFLVFMQRRLSDSFRREGEGQGQVLGTQYLNVPNTLPAVVDSANEHDNVNPEPSSYHLNESPSLHRAG